MLVMASGELLTIGEASEEQDPLNANDNNVQGDITLRGNSLTVVNKSTQPIKNIHVWSSAFMIYASLMLEKFPNKGLEFFKYMHTVRMAASRGYSLGWVNYDEQYRLRKATSPSSSWGAGLNP
jgi:hypothetical protein